MDGKLWSPPDLVVLARGRPQELSLEFCKTMLQATGPGFADLQCMLSLEEPPYCITCDTLAVGPS